MGKIFQQKPIFHSLPPPPPPPQKEKRKKVVLFFSSLSNPPEMFDCSFATDTTDVITHVSNYLFDKI
jgi:hypothetical protein